jgi:Dyp-type peroxidase family
MVHTLFSIVGRIVDGEPVDVREDDLAFDALAGLHFASVVVFDQPAGAAVGEFPRHVVLESCIDGPVDDYLDALVFEPRRRAAVGALFERCEEFGNVQAYDSASDEYRDSLKAFLAAHVLRPQLFHIGSPNLRLDHIRAGDALRRALSKNVQELMPGLSSEPPLDVARRLRAILRVPVSEKRHWHLDPATLESREYAWFSDPVGITASRIRHWGTLALAIGLAVAAGFGLWVVGGWTAVGAAVAGVVVGAFLFWRWLQGKHVAPEPPRNRNDIDALHHLTEQEDAGVHNHMSSLALLKPGLFRRITIRAVLRTLNLIYRTWFTDLTPGKLGGLPTIHFAQWSIVTLTERGEKPRREAVMFLSNYDGSWETYLDDFIEFLLNGVIAIWGNAATFPSPMDGRIFKRWARTQMSPFAVWHDKAYPPLTVSNIQNNNRLRLGMLQPPRTDHDARLWLARLGAIMRGDEQFDDVAGPLPTEDMQGLLVRGYGTLPYAAFALLRIDDGDAARHWLRHLAGAITDGRELDGRDRTVETEAVNVAFTHKALELLGLPAQVRERFPLPFREGIAPLDENDEPLHHRSRILGDVGASAPENWAWGGRRGREREVDVLLMMYGRTPEALADLRRRQIDMFRASDAGEVVDTILSEPSADGPGGMTVEHFGFVDGLSQPKIEGTWQAKRAYSEASPAHLIKPGEFILGYEAGDGSVTPGVPVEPAFDHRGVLPFASGAGDLRDFGRNGTFLVARQLAQHVAEFRKFTTDVAGVPPSQHAARAAESVAARVVGRWRSGTPLVEHPTTEDPNAFTFASDPHGFGCPIGAHIRRANPRDSLGAGGAAAQTSANRHRLVRRGRAYGAPLPAGRVDDDGAPRGLMFVCLNADIERQFEFVQQNWINNPAFGGLYAERDPLIGALEIPAHLTVQANAVCTEFEGLSRFVSVAGGGYFFLPGMSALRYLAHLEPRALLQPADAAAIPAPPPSVPSPLRSAFAVVAAVLPTIRLLWAIRFPLLLAVLLVVLPFTAAWIPAISLPLFLTNTVGAILIAFLASTAAWAAMVMLRLVLMYGTRVGLSRPKWTRSAKWLHVFGFQLLALPIVIAAVHYTAQDFANAAAGSYRDVAIRLSLAAAGGLALGLLALGLATAIQSLRPGSRPDLFSPPFPILTPLFKRLARMGLIHRVLRGISSLSAAIVSSVPEEIGIGYINYRNRRLLPGHAFAAALASLVFVVYVAGFFVFDPARRPAQLEVPAVAYVLFMLIAIGWLLSAASFFFDRYRIPTLLSVVVWLIAVATIARTDHIFEVGGPIEPAASPAEIATAAQKSRPGKAIIVASEGYALASSAWTAEVLTRLAAEGDGRQFANAVRLISASSGGTIGTTHFVNAFTAEGFGVGEGDALAKVRERARVPGSTDGWWGLVYPDLVRAFVPFLVPARADRGWAMEQAWRREFPDGKGPTLSGWRRDVAAGWRPATVFGVTSVETGEQGLLATYRARTRNPDGPDFVTADRDLPMIAAARLAASFPYVSPMARPDTEDRDAYHFTDGGFWDNSGIVAALQWIEDAGAALGEVMLIEVRSSPPRGRKPAESMPWTLEAIGPLRTLVEVRYDGHAARTEQALQQFMRTHPLQRVIFELNDARVPFTWSLGRSHVKYIEDAWKRGDNQAQRQRVLTFLSAQ